MTSTQDLFQLPDIDFLDAAADDQLAEFLDEQFEAALELSQFTLILTYCVLNGLRDSNPAAFKEFEPYLVKLRAMLPAAVEVVEVADGREESERGPAKA